MISAYRIVRYLMIIFNLIFLVSILLTSVYFRTGEVILHLVDVVKSHRQLTKLVEELSDSFHKLLLYSMQNYPRILTIQHGHGD